MLVGMLLHPHEFNVAEFPEHGAEKNTNVLASAGWAAMDIITSTSTAPKLSIIMLLAPAMVEDHDTCSTQPCYQSEQDINPVFRGMK